MHINLLNFLKTGRFGDVALGMSREEVLRILGEPTHIWDREFTSHWSYGYITFIFSSQSSQDKNLYWIHCDRLLSPLYNGDKFILEESIVTSELSLFHAEMMFQEQHIAYEKCKQDIGGNEISYQIRLDSGVHLYFYPIKPNTFHLRIFSKRD